MLRTVENFLFRVPQMAKKKAVKTKTEDKRFTEKIFLTSPIRHTAPLESQFFQRDGYGWAETGSPD